MQVTFKLIIGDEPEERKGRRAGKRKATTGDATDNRPSSPRKNKAGLRPENRGHIGINKPLGE